LRAEPDLTVTDTPRHLFFQLPKRAADDEQNMPGVDRVAFSCAAPLKFERRLQLRLEIVHAAHRTSVSSISFSSVSARRPADIAAYQISSRRDLVDLINVNDAELRKVHVAVGLVHQLAHEILHVASDVTGLAELRPRPLSQTAP